MCLYNLRCHKVLEITDSLYADSRQRNAMKLFFLIDGL